MATTTKSQNFLAILVLGLKFYRSKSDIAFTYGINKATDIIEQLIRLNGEVLIFTTVTYSVLKSVLSGLKVLL